MKVKIAVLSVLLLLACLTAGCNCPCMSDTSCEPMQKLASTQTATENSIQ